MRGRRYDAEQDAFIVKLCKQHGDDWKAATVEFNKAFPDYRRKANDIQRRYRDHLALLERAPGSPKRDALRWEAHKKRFVRVAKCFQQVVDSLDTRMKRAQGNSVYGYRAEIARLKRELRDTKRANDQLAAKNAQLQRVIDSIVGRAQLAHKKGLIAEPSKG